MLRSKNRFTPRLELLEDRTVMNAMTFNALINNNWSLIQNWDSGTDTALPTATTDVTLGANVDIDTDASCASYNDAAYRTEYVGSYTLTINTDNSGAGGTLILGQFFVDPTYTGNVTFTGPNAGSTTAVVSTNINVDPNINVTGGSLNFNVNGSSQVQIEPTFGSDNWDAYKTTFTIGASAGIGDAGTFIVHACNLNGGSTSGCTLTVTGGSALAGTVKMTDSATVNASMTMTSVTVAGTATFQMATSTSLTAAVDDTNGRLRMASNSGIWGDTTVENYGRLYAFTSSGNPVTITGTLDVKTNGRVQIGNDGGGNINRVSQLNVTGAVSFDGSSELTLYVAPIVPQFSTLVCDSSLTITSGAVLDLDFNGGLPGTHNSQYVVSSFGTPTGTFTLNPALPAGYTISYDSDGIKLSW